MAGEGVHVVAGGSVGEGVQARGRVRLGLRVLCDRWLITKVTSSTVGEMDRRRAKTVPIPPTRESGRPASGGTLRHDSLRRLERIQQLPETLGREIESAVVNLVEG